MPPAGLLAGFEIAMELMQRHQYAEAADAFRDLLTGVPDGGGPLLDRARVYLGLCERELARRPQPLRSVEERLTAATAALNDERDRDAEHLASSVLAEQPRNELALYLLAAVNARLDDSDRALDLLSQAVAVSPEILAQARHDPDFESIRSSDAFQRLLGLPVGGAEPLRPRRSHGDR